jgi:hypothetical protein
MPFVYRTLLKKLSITDEDAKTVMTDLLQRFCGRKQIPLQSFLLPEGHPIIVKYYRSLMVKEFLRSGDSLVAAGYDVHGRSRSRVSPLKKPAKKGTHDQAFQEKCYTREYLCQPSEKGPRDVARTSR